MEIPHCILESFHYRAVRENPEYRMMGQLEILREELMMQMPINTVQNMEIKSVPEPEWVKRQWDIVQQLQNEVRGWRRKHANLQLAVDKLTKQIQGGGDLI